MTPPLAGIRVLDLTRLLPGGICTLMLADLGAQVIKIESPVEGDYARWSPPLIDGMGAFFHATNRGKQSVILNLKDGAGCAALLKLVESADVFVESFRPGVTARLGCDYETLKAINPRLVYCAISGYGQTGPDAQLSGHDLNYVALAGLIGEMNQPQVMGGQIADVGGAYTAVAGICAALFRREKTGTGAFIDISMMEAALPFVSYAWVEAVSGSQGESELPRGVLSGRYACYNIYMTRDRKAVALAALEPRFWGNFCNAIERPDLVADYMKLSRQRYLQNEVAQTFGLRSLEEWDAILLNADCCYSRVRSVHDLVSDPHIQARGSLDLGANGVPFMRSPIRIDGAEVRRGHVPTFGEHTFDVLRAAGFEQVEIEALLK